MARFAGVVIGARYGASSVRVRWLECVHERDRIKGMADDLIGLGAGTPEQVRIVRAVSSPGAATCNPEVKMGLAVNFRSSKPITGKSTFIAENGQDLVRSSHVMSSSALFLSLTSVTAPVFALRSATFFDGPDPISPLKNEPVDAPG